MAKAPKTAADPASIDAPAPAAEATAAPSAAVPLRASELAYLTEYKARHPGATVGEVRTQRFLDPATGEVTEFQVRVVKTKRPRGRR